MAIPLDGFVHLHLHSDYSLLDGGNRIDRLIERVKELGMSAVALTDHGNLFGAVEFYTKAKDAGIQPILGIEAYVASGDRRDRTYTGLGDGGFHLVLLAQDNTGWQNLLKLSSDSFINGFYYKPRMDKTTLAQWSSGLIAINGHLGSSLAHHLQRYERTKDESDFAQALEEARWHVEAFTPVSPDEPRFFIELQRNGVSAQEAINPHLQRLAAELRLPLVCDNDAHFLTEQDHDAHDTLCCISMAKSKADTQRLKYPREVYVKTSQQMAELFKDVPEAIENTRRIARRCNVELDFSKSHAPMVQIEKSDVAVDEITGETTERSSPPDIGSTTWYNTFCSQYRLLPFDSEQEDTDSVTLGADCDQALRELAEAGAVWRYGEHGITDEIRARLDRELAILAGKRISAYFLIVWDFVNEARRRNIPSLARGSSVGTMVGYCLGLSNACPVRYGLLFERFTDPDRYEYPDIDIDICQDGRQQIIDYVRQKYGHVAQIITFGTLKARAAIRDVGRVLDVPLPEVDKVCKLVGDALGTTLDQALEQEPDLHRLYDENPTHREMIDTARQLEGFARHAGVHAAGVVIATQPLDNIVPLSQPSGSEQIVTQWDGPTCDRIGLLKMDFLGLRTLSIIQRCKDLVEASIDKDTQRQTVRGELGAGPCPDSPREFNAHDPVIANTFDPLALDRLTYADQNVLDLFRRGDTAAVFQFESGGFRNLLIGMQPDRIEDLIAANALYRPGPMELIGEYNDRKHGRASVPQLHPIVEKYTGVTYGVLTYQEQVMQLMHELGGVPLFKAYTIIKAISKKKKSVIDESRPGFLEGAQEAGMAKQEAEELFERILKFSGYGFNKSHSTGYSILAYETAYLKTYFPVHYMAAVLTYESVNIDKVVEYIDECKRVLFPDEHRGIVVKPPDINRSDVAFTVVFDDDEPRDANHGHISFGLSAVKGVGDKAVDAVIAERRERGPFQSLYEFCERVPLHAVTRATIDALIKCGAFDSVHGLDKRSAMTEAVDAAIQAGQSAAADREAGQLSFFESFVEASDASDPSSASVAVSLPNVSPWPTAEQLKYEKSVLGFYVSSHPLDQHRLTIKDFGNATVAQVRELPADQTVVVGGVIMRVRTTVTRKGPRAGEKMAIITLEDHSGLIDAIVFSDTYAITAPLLQPDAIVFFKGRVDRRREEPSIVAEEIIPIDQASSRLTETVKIVLKDTSGLSPGVKSMSRSDGGNGFAMDPGAMQKLKQLLNQSSRSADGGSTVLFEVQQDDYVALIRVNGVRVGVDADLPKRIDTVLQQDGCCQLIGPGAILPCDAPV